MVRQKNTKLKPKPLSFISKKLIWIGLVSCIIIFTYFSIQKEMHQFPITTVKIDGKITRISKQEIWGSISDLLKGGFFATDVVAIKTSLQKLPWIETVKVEKTWPDKLTITISEKVPIARWRGKGLLTTSGDILYTESLNEGSKLPVFWGSEQQAKKVLENYLAMNEELKRNNVNVVEIEIMPDQGVRAILNNGIMLFLGQDRLLEKINRFNLAYRNKLQKMSQKIDYVDLRYVNGIAIGWKGSISKIYLDEILNDHLQNFV
jgi:cell division protein FtsQ